MARPDVRTAVPGFRMALQGVRRYCVDWAEMADLDPADQAYCAAEVSRENGTAVIRLSGELDMVSIESVRSAIEAALDGESERLVFDVGGLEFMDSSGIALLISVARKVRTVEVRNPTDIVRRIIELTGLTEILLMVP
jgi:anti-anti-sigma factor